MHAPHNAPMAVKIKSIISTAPCPFESHHSFIAPARHPAAKPIETPKIHPNTKPIAMPTHKCLRLSVILAAFATPFHASATTSPTSIQNALKRAKNGVFSNTLSPATNTGGCVLPDITPNHTFPPNNMAMRSLIDGFQHETHCLPSHHTGNAPHCESDNVPGFCNTFVDCEKSIGFISLSLNYSTAMQS